MREGVLTPPELRLVEVLGMRIRAYQAFHGVHGLFGAAELVVRPRHLIENLVAVLVTGVFGEQPIIESDRLEWTDGICAGAKWVRREGVVRQVLTLRGRAPLEILIGFLQAGGGGRRVRISIAGQRVRQCLGGLRSGHFPRLSVARAYPELLLELQVRETPDRLGSHRGLRCLIEETPVVEHGLIEALLDLEVLHVGAHLMQVRQRPHRPQRPRRLVVATRGAAGHESQPEQNRNGKAHQRPSAPGLARAARS